MRTLAFACALTSALTGAAVAQAQQYPYGQQPYPPPQQPYAPQQPYPQQPYGQPSYPQQQMQTAPTGSVPYTPLPRNDDEDSGRKLEFFYARAGAGAAFVSLDALGGDNVKLQSLDGIGGAMELGLGARLLLVTVGPRARALVLSNATLWQLGGEVALRIPMGRWDPFVSLQGGYTFGQKPREDIDCGAPAAKCRPFSATGPMPDDPVGITGADLGLAGGLDYYLTPMFSLGGDLAVMMLFLTRDAVPQTTEPALDRDASMTGLGVKLGVHVGLHL